MGFWTSYVLALPVVDYFTFLKSIFLNLSLNNNSLIFLSIQISNIKLMTFYYDITYSRSLNLLWNACF